ncbi:DUF1080 domain-containing protein [soil metagenome]
MTTLSKIILSFSFYFFIPFMLVAQSSLPTSEIFGRWNLTIQSQDGNQPAWLEVKKSGTKTMVGYYVGPGGSARPISKIEYDQDRQLFTFSIPPQWENLKNDLFFQFSLSNNEITGSTTLDQETVQWKGVRAPDLIRESASVWGKPNNLLDENLAKWNIPENNQFRYENGILINKKTGGNLVSKEKYNDFKLQLEFRYPENSNSGVYLRGRYEIQIADDYGKKPSEQTLGGIYGFIEPSVNAAKKANEWQTLEVTLVGRLVTIVINGVEVVVNRPIPGITGGALDSNEGMPGPIMIQGDHGPVELRNMVITPAVN